MGLSFSLTAKIWKIKMSKDYLKELKSVMAALRTPGSGCPWDLEQTHQSLKPYLIEESSEVLDAIDNNDMQNLKEELGDVLMNIYFHAQLAEEAGEFTIEDVAQDISEKMIRRHPHVFAVNEGVESSEDVVVQWEEIKKQEKGDKHKSSRLDGVTRSLPSLARAQKIQKKAAKCGFDWPSIEEPLAKLDEEIDEFKEAMRHSGQDHIEEEFGDMLFSMVNIARHKKINSEDAMRQATNKFAKRFQLVEELAEAKGLQLEDMSLEEMDLLWDEAKKL